MVVSLSLYSSSLPGGSQTFPILITVSLMVLRLSLYISQSPWWYSYYTYTHQSAWWYSDYPFTHHSLPGGSQTILLHFSVYLVVLRLSLYSSQSPWLYLDCPYTHHSLSCGEQTIPLLFRLSLKVLGLSHY